MTNVNNCAGKLVGQPTLVILSRKSWPFIAKDARLDIVDIDAEFIVELYPCFGARLDGLGVSFLIVALAVKFCHQSFVPLGGWQVTISQLRIHDRANLLDG